MTKQEWLTSTDPAAMLRYVNNFLRVGGGPSGRTAEQWDRKLRLFACACCRQVWDGQVCEPCGGTGKIEAPDPASGRTTGEWETIHRACNGTGRIGGLTDPRSGKAVEVAEKFADGLATQEELHIADLESTHPCIGQENSPGFATAWVASLTPIGFLQAPERLRFQDGIHFDRAVGAIQASLLRDIFGNPFRRFSAGPEHATLNMAGGVPTEWLAWNDRTIPRLAQSIYDDRAWDRMPILADALEEAGCTDEAILDHCRGIEPYCECATCSKKPGTPLLCKQCLINRSRGWQPLRGPHCRGCWVLDLILCKS